ncbi:unnamed protein product [Parnassius apollo]|uniref:(apollo) hypothetical protein n=1 Tax=Parnassius apollo TaxID=110799 RepID=A0A8S3X4I2_PARAO|nr:unnamed protein product [Parnassius apollo]
MLVGRYRPHGHIRYLYLAFCKSRRLLSTTEIADALEASEEVEDIQGIDVYIDPPCNGEISDGDSGEEDCCDFDRLNRYQLLAPAELVIHTSKDDQHVEIEAIEPEISSPTPHKTRRMPKKSQPAVTISNEQLRQAATCQDRPFTSQEQSSSSATSSRSGACPLLQQKPRQWTKRDINLPQNVWVQSPPRTVLTLSKESEPLEFFELFISEDGKNIKVTGTVRQNRIDKCPLMDVKSVKNQKRGYYDYRLDTNDQICTVRWNGNSVITLLSNEYGVHPIQKAKHHSAVEKKMVDIQQPYVVQQDIRFMGGVDRLDANVGTYKIAIRGKKMVF